MKRSFVRFFIRFMKFCLWFLGIFTVLSLWGIFTEKDYINLLPLGFGLAYILILIFCLYNYFGKMAEEFSIQENQITFMYLDHTEFLLAKDIDYIIITPYRYLFLNQGKKTALSRIKGQFKLEKRENSEILDFAYRFHINIQRK